MIVHIALSLICRSDLYVNHDLASVETILQMVCRILWLDHMIVIDFHRLVLYDLLVLMIDNTTI